VFAAFCGVLLLLAATGASAQSRMPLESPLKPINAVHDSIPVPVIYDPVAEGFEELILELRAGQEASRSEFGYARDGHMWVPAIAAFELVELRADVDSLGVLSSMLEPDRLGLNLYPREMEAWRGTYYRLTHPGDLFLHDGVLYAKATDLAWVLDVRLYEQFDEMAVVFDGIGDLPLGRRLHRERMRRIDDLYGAEPDVVFGPERTLWRGATLDWNVGVPSFQVAERTVYGLGFGGALFGGAMDARYRGRIDGGGDDQFDARWQGVWPDQQWLRQLEIGSTRGTGPRGQAIDGVALGNSPFLRATEFGETVLRGEARPGWEVEIYRNGRLLAWDRVDDRGFWEFTIPLDYGQNPVEVRTYGPNGEVQITERAVRVDFDRIPGGSFEYGLSAGRSDFRGSDFAGNADLRYGISNRWTARAGYEGYGLESGGEAHHPYAALTGSVAGPLRVGAERVVDAWWWTAASVENSSDFRLGVEHFRYDRQGASRILVNEGSRERTILDFFWRPIRARRNLFFDFDAERLETAWDRQTSFVLGATTMLHRVRLSGQLKEYFDRAEMGTWRRSAMALQASTVLRSGSRAWWHGTQVRAEAEVGTRYGINDWVKLSLGRRLGRSARLEVGAGWYRPDDAYQFTIGLSSAGPHAYVNAWVNGRQGSGASTQLSAEGSLLYHPETGRVETYPFRSLGRGGLTGTVFVDRNANGVFDSGEEPVAGARLTAGYLVAETDEFGRYSIWNLAPFEGADVQVDPQTLRNPMWVPAFDLAQAAVSPNGFRRIDLPLIEALEIEGVVRTRVGDAVHCPGAVPVKLVQVGGDREYRTRCFSDGEFYLSGVLPGTYRIEIAESWLEARGLRVAPESRAGFVAPAGALVAEFEVILEPAG
jgi:hypothetical protein